MSSALYISASCVIRNFRVYKNGSFFFEAPQKELPAFLTALYQFSGVKYPKFYKMDNLSKLGFLGAEILLEGFDKTAYEAPDAGIVLSNASSSLDTDRKYYETVKDIPSPALFVYTLPNIVIGELCIRHNFKGENAFFISESFDAGFIEQYVANLFNNDILQVCLCGWLELMGDHHEAALFLVEKKEKAGPETFSAEHIKKIYQKEHG